MNNLKQSDSGYYVCLGKNSQGTNRDYAYVQVREAREDDAQSENGSENESVPTVEIKGTERQYSVNEGLNLENKI